MNIPPPPITNPVNAVRESDTWYWHEKSKSWNKNPTGASVRLISQRRLQVQGVIESRVQKFTEGRWQKPENVDLPWWWRAYPRTIINERWLVFEGPQPLTREFWDQYGQVDLFTLQGDKIDQAELAGHRFMLRLEDAKGFSQRLQKDSVGTIAVWQADESPASDLVKDIQKIYQQATTWDLEAQKLANQGALTDLHIDRLDTSYGDLLNKANQDLHTLANMVSTILAAPGEEKELLGWAQTSWERAVVTIGQLQTVIRNHNLRKVALSRHETIPDPAWQQLQAAVRSVYGEDVQVSDGQIKLADGTTLHQHPAAATDEATN